jgi:hypothetical protein
MIQVVGRLPVVEDFVAILNWGVQSSNDVGSCEYVEGREAFAVVVVS